MKPPPPSAQSKQVRKLRKENRLIAQALGALDARISALEEGVQQETQWRVRRANNAATGGDFGFGRVDKTEIETPERRWETGKS